MGHNVIACLTHFGAVAEMSPSSSKRKASASVAAGAANARRVELKAQQVQKIACSWFNVAALSTRTPAAEVLYTTVPILLGMGLTAWPWFELHGGCVRRGEKRGEGDLAEGLGGPCRLQDP